MPSPSGTSYYPPEGLEGEWEDSPKGYFIGGQNYGNSQSPHSPSTQANSPLEKFGGGNAQYAERNFCSGDSGFKLSKSLCPNVEGEESGLDGVRRKLYGADFDEFAGNDGEEVDF